MNILRFKTNIIKFLVIWLLLINKLAHAIDVIPGQAIAPPPGLNIGMVSFVHQQKGDRYKSDRLIDSNSEITIDAFLLRYTRTFKLFDNPTAFYVQPTIGNVNPGGSLSSLDSSEGIGDTAFAFAYWPYANRESGTYWAVVGYLVAPSGEYDRNNLINLGQNRFSAAVQTDYHTRISENFDVMLAVDAQWFEDNEDYLGNQILSQDILYSAQLSMMYNITTNLMLAGSFIHHEGGETQLNGLDQQNEIDTDRFQFAASLKLGTDKLIFQYSKALETKNGFEEENHFNLRYMSVF